MIYLSAQPDHYYFIWQLEIQLRNFHGIGIGRDNIHVLISYDPITGLKSIFHDFISQNKDLAKFFTYPDTRKKRKYPSSIRPHIIAKHYLSFPDLLLQPIFYHDSDILLSRVPDIKRSDLTLCLVSDTRNYLDSEYILRVSSMELLKGMAKIVGISVPQVVSGDAAAGGAQYFINGVDASFWEKVERDCEDLYVLMCQWNTDDWNAAYPDKRFKRSTHRGIQAWCSDMWAVLWNLWLIGLEVKVDPEMEFSWPNNPIADWKKMAILHYSGGQVDRANFFKKTDYITYSPWYDTNLNSIPKSNCSRVIVESILARKEELNLKRMKLDNTCFLIVVNEREWDFARINGDYLRKMVTSPIFYQIGQPNMLPPKMETGGSGEGLESWTDFLRPKYGQVKRAIVINSNVLITMDVLSLVLNDFHTKDGNPMSFTFQNNLKLDWLFVEAFSKVLDEKVLLQNQGKFQLEKSGINDQILMLTREHLLQVSNDPNLLELMKVRQFIKVQVDKHSLFTFPSF